MAAIPAQRVAGKTGQRWGVTMARNFSMEIAATAGPCTPRTVVARVSEL